MKFNKKEEAGKPFFVFKTCILVSISCNKTAHKNKTKGRETNLNSCYCTFHYSHILQSED